MCGCVYIYVVCVYVCINVDRNTTAGYVNTCVQIFMMPVCIDVSECVAMYYIRMCWYMYFSVCGYFLDVH